MVLPTTHTMRSRGHVDMMQTRTPSIGATVARRNLIIGIVIGLVVAGLLVGAYALGVGGRDDGDTPAAQTPGAKEPGGEATPTVDSTDTPDAASLPLEALAGTWYGYSDSGPGSAGARWRFDFAGASGSGTVLITSPTGAYASPVSYGVEKTAVLTDVVKDRSGKSSARGMTALFYDKDHLVVRYSDITAQGATENERVLILARTAEAVDAFDSAMAFASQGMLGFDAGDPPGTDAYNWLLEDGSLDASKNLIGQ